MRIICTGHQQKASYPCNQKSSKWWLEYQHYIGNNHHSAKCSVILAVWWERGSRAIRKALCLKHGSDLKSWTSEVMRVHHIIQHPDVLSNATTTGYKMHIQRFLKWLWTDCILSAASGLHSSPEHLSLGLNTNSHTRPSPEFPTSPHGRVTVWKPDTFSTAGKCVH